MAGDYSGAVVFTSATPAGHCFAAGLARLNGHGFRYRVAVQQAGTQLTGSLENTDMGIHCSFSGTVSAGGEIRWAQTTCSDPLARFSWSSEAQRTCELSVTQTGHGFEGRGRVSGDLTLDWNTADATTGADLGAIQIRVRLSLS